MKALGTAVKTGFSYVELVIAILLVGGVIVFILNVVPNGILVFSLGHESTKLYYLAREKMTEVRAQKIWIQNVNTASPIFPTRSYDLANVWKTDLNRNGRNFAATVNGQIQITILRSDYTAFSFFDYWFTPRERFQISLTLSEGANNVSLQSYLTIPASKNTLTGILHLIHRGLLLYNEDKGSYPSTNQLYKLVPNYIPYVPNDPYTTITIPAFFGTEDDDDYEFTLSGGTRTLYAKSHPTTTYPQMTLVW